MTTKFNSLIHLKGDDPPWLYAMGSEACIDLNGYTSREEWERRRKHPIEKTSRSFRRADSNLVLCVLLLAATVLMPDQAPTWLAPVASVLLGVAVMISVLKFFRLRSAKTNMVIAAPNSSLHREILLLSRTLVAIHALKVHAQEDHVDFEVEGIDQVDPEALTAMAKSLLQLEFPHVDAEYVRSVRTDIANSLYQATGVQLAAE